MKLIDVPRPLWMTETSAHQYHFLEDEQCRVWYSGIIVYKNGSVVNHHVLEIAEMARTETLNFNYLLGFYKIVIEEKQTGRMMFWGDHSGSQRFYLSEAVFSDTLPGCIQRLPEPIEPNYSAILQYFSMNCTMDDSTIVAGIQKTNCECYYTLCADKIKTYSKALLPFSQITEPYSLHELIKALLEGINPKELSAVATGGTDSRTILAHITSLGYRPELLITGRGESKDVQLAKRVAASLATPLHVYDSAEKEDQWLQRAYDFSHGLYDVVASYRHLRKAEQSQALGFRYEFGGAGGEFYKNSYYRPFRSGLWKRTVTDEIVFADLVGRQLRNQTWFGAALCSELEHTQKTLLARFKASAEPGRLRNYNKLGFLFISGTICNIAQNFTPYAVKVDPLVDRNIIASVCGKQPIWLSMARWQRKEIHQYCPQLSDIETAQGYTCSVNPLKLTLESCKALFYYGILAAGRIKRKLFGAQKQQLWDLDYKDAIASPEFQVSVKICKDLGVIAEEISPADIPLNMTGLVLMVGMTFSQENRIQHS